MPKSTLFLTILAMMILTTSAFSGQIQTGVGITGKHGQSVPLSPTSPTSSTSDVRALIEYNTAGEIDAPATNGGDYEGWGTHFLARWENNTETNISVIELGFPCGGFWSAFWYVWISEELPGAPGSQDYRGSFVAVSEDDTEYPPSQYTYIDVSDQEIIIPVGATMYFGYGNPGMGGQVLYSGVETWSWYDQSWDSDSTYNRTAVLQFKGEAETVGSESETLSGVKALYR